MDSERRPLVRRPIDENVRLDRKTKLACFAVLTTETLERIAFYGIVGNLVLFLNSEPFDWMSYNAMNTMFIFTGVSYMSSLLSGWMSDSFLGKFKSIAICLAIYIVGYTFFPLLSKLHNKNTEKCYSKHSSLSDHGGIYSENMTIPSTTESASPLHEEPCFWFVLPGLIIVAIATGGVKSNIAPFGADQVRRLGPHLTRSFFNWYYWCINIGCFLSLGVIAYVQQDSSFFYGYLAPNVCLVLALVAFLIGSCVYVKKPPGGSVLSNVFRVLWEGCCRSRRAHASCTRPHVDEADPVLEQSYECLDGAKVRYGGSFHDNLVDDVKTLLKITAVFLALVPYWAVYFQMETTYPFQGLHMRLGSSISKTNCSAKEDSSEFRVPIAWLSLFDVLFLIFLLPFFDRVVYPRLSKAGRMPSLRVRIVIGMCFAAISVLVAGGVELWRLQNIKHKHILHQCIGSTMYDASHLHVAAQIPQYALIGISEVFASVAGLELAYTCAPRSMVSLIMGIFWFTQGLGSFVGAATYSAFHVIYKRKNGDHGDINCNATHNDEICLYRYFFFMAGVQCCAIIIFVLITWRLQIGGSQTNRNGTAMADPVSPNQNSRNNYTNLNSSNQSTHFSPNYSSQRMRENGNSYIQQRTVSGGSSMSNGDA